MHDAGGYVDVSTLLPLFLSVVLIAVSLAFLRNTAAKYLTNTNLRFDPDPVKIQQRQEQEKEKEESTPMLDQQNVCAVCGEPGLKRCSRCKSVRYWSCHSPCSEASADLVDHAEIHANRIYRTFELELQSSSCSLECQTKHWNQGHKQDCRSATTLSQGTSKNAFNFTNAFETYKKGDCLLKASSAGVPYSPSNGTSDCTFPKPKKVLFPYETFVEFFNWDKQRLTPCGLVNCGNSCFANVVLQCLTCTRPLVAYLLEGSHMLTCARNDWCFLCELHQHIRRVCQSEEPFSPFEILCHIPKLGGNLGCGKQEDAHEFMRVAIDSMQSICLDEFGGEKAVDPDSRLTTLICHIFGGYLQSQVICTRCHQVSNRYEHMLDLNVEIHGDVASLEDALDQFTGHEWLDGENKYNCDGFEMCGGMTAIFASIVAIAGVTLC